MLDQGYGIMPNRVLFDPEISSTAKLVFVFISSLCAKEGFCWASNEYLADQFGVGKTTISQAISQLKDYLVIEDGANQHRRICLSENCNPAFKKLNGSLSKNRKHNSTSEKYKENTTPLPPSGAEAESEGTLLDDSKAITVVPPAHPATSQKQAPADAERLAELLAVKVIENYPFMEEKITAADRARWVAALDKLNRIDGMDWRIIEYVLIWSQQDDFWKQNVRSGETLRRQFTKLMVRIKGERDKAQRGAIVDIDALVAQENNN